MATLSLFDRRNRNGTIQTNWLSISGFREVTARIDALAADFDDPSLVLTVRIEHSTDGGASVGYAAEARIVGGGRGKDGSLPCVGLANVNGGHVRLTLTLSKNARIGLTGEVI